MARKAAAHDARGRDLLWCFADEAEEEAERLLLKRLGEPEKRRMPASEAASFYAAHAISGLWGIKAREIWAPRGQLADAALYFAFGLSRPPAARSGEWSKSLFADRCFSNLAEIVAEARHDAHEKTIEELAASDEPGAEQILEAADRFFHERQEDETKIASDALFYFLAWVGFSYAVEQETLPPAEMDRSEAHGRGFAAALRICEPLALDLYLAFADADRLYSAGWEKEAALEEVFPDEKLLEAAFGRCQIGADAILELRPSWWSPGRAIRELLAKRWLTLDAGFFPWGESAPYLVPDPVRLGSTKQLPPAGVA